MPDFAYIARDAGGQKVAGKISAATPREAAMLLSGRSLFPINVRAEKPATPMPFGRRVSGQLIATTYSQLAALLRSGVPLLRAILVIRDQTSHKKLKEILQDVHRRVEDGGTLAEAMTPHRKVFDDMAINMIRAGGEGGFLEEALDRVASFTEQQVDLKARTIGQLIYPMVLVVVGVAVVTGLLIFIVPNFEVYFDQLREKGELPVATDVLLWTSDKLARWWWAMLLVAVCAFVYVRLQLETEPGKRMRDLWKLRVPLFGRIFMSLAVARFCRVLGTLLKNGVPILRSLEISRQAAGNRILSEAVAGASENISAGQSLAQPLAVSGHFPATVVEMIAVAEESNTLETVLTDIADGLERRTARQLELMVRLIEPVLLMLLAGMVLFMVIALLLPLLKMSAVV